MTAALVISGRRLERTGLSNSDEWRTPDRLFNACSDHYGPFNLDSAAARWNYQCSKYFTLRDNALKRPWRGRVWCNPPYSKGNLMKWTAYARGQLGPRGAELVCLLVPAYTSERWWQAHVLEPYVGRGRAELIQRAGIGSGFRACWAGGSVEVLFVNGRLRFRHETGVQDSARHPSAVVVFSRE